MKWKWIQIGIVCLVPVIQAWVGNITQPNYPRPFYGPIEVPKIIQDKFNEGQPSNGLDYLTVFHPARAGYFDQSYYDCQIDEECRMTSSDRLPSFAPWVFWFYEHSLSRLKFSTGYQTNAGLQIVLMAAATLIAGWWLGMGLIQTSLALLLTGVLTFLTPIGWTWYERGQFDLYPTAGILLFFAVALRPDKRGALALSFFAGFLASLKWSILPGLGILGLTLLVLDWKKYWKVTFAVGAGFGFPAIFFLPEMPTYFKILRAYESADPNGISYAQWTRFPKWVMFIPLLVAVILTVIRALPKWKQDLGPAGHFDLVALYFSISIFNVPYGTWAYEYRALMLLALVVPWLYSIGKNAKSQSTWLLTFGMILMSMLFLRSFPFHDMSLVNEATISRIYFATALIFSLMMLRVSKKV